MIQKIEAQYFVSDHEIKTTGEAKAKAGLSKKTIDIFRTTQRNNIDLTALADNKANVLLSLNAFIIAALVPLVITNLDNIVAASLFIPLVILALTCFVTVYISAQVLKPSDFDNFREQMMPEAKVSPFFFGNFYQMEAKEYFQHIEQSLAEPQLIKAHLTQDLYYVGRRLGQKMELVRLAYNLFIIGIFLTMASTVAVLLFF
ncbi:MAG: Pycsar system effector family protein [Bacteroidota bacterium]